MEESEVITQDRESPNHLILVTQGLQTSGTSVTWELVRNADSWAASDFLYQTLHEWVGPITWVSGNTLPPTSSSPELQAIQMPGFENHWLRQLEKGWGLGQ